MPARLYIAAKPPLPGLVKTRLARTIGAESSASLYAAFLEDLATMVAASGIPAGWFVPPATGWSPPPLGPAQLPSRWQVGDSWGARQSRLFLEELGGDPGPLVLIASDSPQLVAGDIRAAFAALGTADVVLGPVLDGGYYLVGMHRAHDILATVEMSTALVCADVVARAHRLALEITLLSPRFDVDEAADLDLLRAADAPHLTMTRGWLEKARMVPA